MEVWARTVKSRTCFDHQRLAGEPEGWSSGCEEVDQVIVLGRIWRGLVMWDECRSYTFKDRWSANTLQYRSSPHP